MSNVPGHSRPRHSMALMVLAAVLGLAAIALSQCRMVPDTVTGLSLAAPGRLSARSSCVRNCNDQYQDAFRAESDRHQAALRECGSDQDCRAAENERHKAITEHLD